MKIRFLALAAIAMTPAASAQDAPLPDDQAAMKAHVLFLASDALRGREAGSPEYRIAAEYVAAQFYAAGLKPAGDGGSYIQKVPLVSYRAADKGDVVLTRPGAAPLGLVFGEDYMPGVVAGAEQTALDAPVVFVGYGLVAPDYKRDDYAGVDVRGKIVAFFGGAPLSFQSEERAHFSSPATKAVIAAAHGAVGAIVLTRATLPQGGASFDRPRTTWARADGTGDSPGVPILATLSGTGRGQIVRAGQDAVVRDHGARCRQQCDLSRDAAQHRGDGRAEDALRACDERQCRGG